MAFKDIILAVAMSFKKAKAYTDSKTSGLAGGVKYIGSVNYYSNLPANPEPGDAYTVKYAGSSGSVADGTEYVWGLNSDTNTMEWIDWSKDCYTKADTDNLLNGKQATIDATHKLSADLVDDSASTNKFTTAAEKETWNGKQATIDSSHKLSSDLVDDTSTTNKFATAAQLSQIETNKSNILSEQAKTTGMTAGGSNYITVGGRRLYVDSNPPTGARTGDLWIGG